MPRSVSVSFSLLPYFSSFKDKKIFYPYSRGESSLPTFFLTFSSENPGFSLVDDRFASGRVECDPVIGSGLVG